MKLIAISASSLMAIGMAACTSTGNTERGVLSGAVLGGAAGAIIGNNTGSGDAGQGAAIGAATGAIAGGVVGNSKDRQQTNQNQIQTGPNGEALIYDRNSNRYYYVDRRSGRSYWANGEYRG